MTIPNQQPQPDPRRPSVSTSSLPLVGSSYGHHHRLPNLSQQALPIYSPPLYHSSSRNDSPYQNSPSLVSASNSYSGTPPAATSNRVSSTPPLPPALLLKNHQHHHSHNHYHTSNMEVSPSSPTNSTTSSSYRPLNVVDALAYLDQVKGRFSDKPDVYNQFLDIMKDFKSQSIDTPGVIERVSTLFKGHPLLISGFNTFLPAGYRIECSIDPRDPNRIIVTTPNGNTTTSTTTTAEELLKINPPPPQHYYTYNQSTYPSSSHYNGNVYNTQLPPQPPMLHQPMIPPPPHLAESTTTATDNSKRPPVEFNHAINYVNRIKNRFAHSPDTYKQFLEILQTYQTEQKPIQEVYSHVQYLFNGAGDLLEEFKQFLPDTSPSPPLKHSSALSTTGGLVTKKKKVYNTKKSKLLFTTKYEEDTISIITSSYNATTFDPSNPSVSMEETELFDRIKQHIGTKPSYEEFLKTLNLYTQQIVDMDLLVVQVKGFLGTDKELFDAFKQAIGYDPKERPIERPIVSTMKPDLGHCKAVMSSPSYRVVPRDWQNQPCSGRDQMCWEVLNDEYVSHPIWASEDSGFVTSKKNVNEEALHRCEEERYEYDLNIEANLNTIALLEPIALRIKSMTPEEQNNMRLKPGLGGPTVSIYERIIKKVYDQERGSDIIDMLYKRPATVIPVLLNRLKLKDQEWKKAQREWNKVWRDLDDKNFYKSMDYQSSTFKTNDKKAIINRALVAEMDTLKVITFDCKDQGVFRDISKLIFGFMGHQSGFTKVDKQKMREFLRSFVPMFFHVEYHEVEEEDFMNMQQDEEEGSIVAEDYSDRESASPHPHYHPKEKTNGKLLRDMFMKNSSPVVKMEEEEEDIEMTDAIVVEEQHGEEEELNLFAPTTTNLYSFLCHSHYFCLFRLYQLLYERLMKMKSLDQQIQLNPALGKTFNKTAVELDLYSNRFEDVDLSNGHYNALLETICHLLDGELDQAVFEENVRYIFGVEAYTIFTVDKLIQSLIKQIQFVSIDKRSIEFTKLFNTQSYGALSSYRPLAERILGGSDEFLYKISFDMDIHQTSMQVLDDKHQQTDQELYDDYITHYIDWTQPTKGIDQGLLKPSFLNRNLKSSSSSSQNDHASLAFVRPELRYKIQQASYHMFYIVGSEDVFYKSNPSPQEKEEKCSSNDWYQPWLQKNDHLTMDAERLYK